MTDDEIDVEFIPELAEDMMQSSDGALDCLDGRYGFVEFWLAKLGVDPLGSAVTFGEGGHVSILHPLTGEWMTPQMIAKKAGTATVSRIQ